MWRENNIYIRTKQWRTLRKVPQGPETGCRSEVSVEVCKKVLTETVTMKRRQTSSSTTSMSPFVWMDSDSSQSGNDSNEYNLSPVIQPVQKIILAPGAMAEDTLGQIRRKKVTPESSSAENTEQSFTEFDSLFEESSSDSLVKSGPSSPRDPVDEDLCTSCQSLFSDMRRWTDTKSETDNNPTSLSCDQWVLLNKRRPQKASCHPKGLLNRCLYRIQTLQAFKSPNATNCSRIHVFQSRKLQRCKDFVSRQSDMRRHRKRSVRRKKPAANKTFSVAHPPSQKTHSARQEPRRMKLLQDSRAHGQTKTLLDRSEKMERKLKFNDAPKAVASKMVAERQRPEEPREDPSRSSEDPSRSSEDPSRSSEDPSRSSEDPSRSSEDPSRSSEDPFRTSADVFSHQANKSDAGPKLDFMKLLAVMKTKQSQIIKECSQ